ncbi:MAG: MobQ family relaxase [Clostridium sp.]
MWRPLEALPGAKPYKPKTTVPTGTLKPHKELITTMAIYHLNVQIIGRSTGRSAIAAAAYRSGDILTNDYDGLTHDYSRKNWISHTEIILPDNAPEIYRDRSTLWNTVEQAEKTATAQLAREIQVALPSELNLEQQTILARAYINKNLVSQGMCADFAIHNPPVTDKNNRPLDLYGNPTNDPDKMIFQNPHAHILLTLRPLNNDGKWQPKSQLSYLCRKDNIEKAIPSPDIQQAEQDGWEKQYRYHFGKRKIWLTAETAEAKGLKRVDKQPKSEKISNPITAEWNSKDSLFRWRESWASMCNQALKDNNISAQIDHRSYANRGINKVPSVHLGPEAYRMEKRGIQTDLGNINREIAEDNIFLHKFKVQIEALEKAQTEHLQQVSSRLESLRSQHIAAAYQQIVLSTSMAAQSANVDKQIAIAGTYAKTTEQIIKAIDTLTQTLESKTKDIATINPLQIKKRESLKSEITNTETQIQSLKNRLENIKSLHIYDNPILQNDKQIIEESQKRITSLKKIQAQTYKEFYILVEENRDNMEQLRDLIRGKRKIYEARTEEKLKEYFGKKFDKSVLVKARAEAPELPEKDGTRLKKSVVYKR